MATIDKRRDNFLSNILLSHLYINNPNNIYKTIFAPIIYVVISINGNIYDISIIGFNKP